MAHQNFHHGFADGGSSRRAAAAPSALFSPKMIWSASSAGGSASGAPQDTHLEDGVRLGQGNAPLLTSLVLLYRTVRDTYRNRKNRNHPF